MMERDYTTAVPSVDRRQKINVAQVQCSMQDGKRPLAIDEPRDGMKLFIMEMTSN